MWGEWWQDCNNWQPRGLIRQHHRLLRSQDVKHGLKPTAKQAINRPKYLNESGQPWHRTSLAWAETLTYKSEMHHICGNIWHANLSTQQYQWSASHNLCQQVSVPSTYCLSRGASWTKSRKLNYKTEYETRHHTASSKNFKVEANRCCKLMNHH